MLARLTDGLGACFLAGQLGYFTFHSFAYILCRGGQTQEVANDGQGRFSEDGSGGELQPRQTIRVSCFAVDLRAMF